MTYIGYKKGRDNRIIVLEIIGKHNESRKDIVDKNYAKMRCSKAKVIDIYNMDNKDEKFNEAFALINNEFKYTINKIVEPNKYNDNCDTVCTGGIHYFKSFEAAYQYMQRIDFDNYTGEVKTWYKNGRIAEKYNFVNGNMNGLHELWYENGQLSQKYNHVNDKMNGLYESWYENGQLYEKYNLVNNKMNGLYESWYKNGQLLEKYNAANDKIYGLREMWSKTGILSTKNYLNGTDLSLYAHKPQPNVQIQSTQPNVPTQSTQYQQPQYRQQQYGQQYYRPQYYQQQYYQQQYQQQQYRQQSPQYYRPQYYQQQYYKRY
jgi:antitoxin component YwqK of YwqJK toxin-antitoxin module